MTWTGALAGDELAPMAKATQTRHWPSVFVERPSFEVCEAMLRHHTSSDMFKAAAVGARA